MGDKKNRLKKRERTCTHDKKNIFMQKVEIVLQHHILLWLLIFPPIGIYRLIKYKVFHKGLIIVLALSLAIFTIFVTYLNLNPTISLEVDISQYLEDNDLGTVREFEYIGSYEGYHMSEVITTKGFYVIYFNYTELRNLNIDTIVSLYTKNQDELAYNQFDVVEQSSDSYELFSQINPAIIKFLSQNNKYGTIETLVEQYPNSQVIRTTKGKYQFKYQFYNTVSIRLYNPDDDSWNDVMNRDNIIEMKPDFVKILNKEEILLKYYEIKDITEYGINEDEIYYKFTNFCDNVYKIVKRNDGKFVLQGYDDNPIPQDELATAWAEYQNTKKDGDLSE